MSRHIVLTKWHVLLTLLHIWRTFEYRQCIVETKFGIIVPLIGCHYNNPDYDQY